MQNICSIDLMTTLKCLEEKRQTIKHSLKVKDSIGLKKLEERDWQLLVEIIIHAVEFKSLYENSIEKKPKIIEIVENNYKIIIRIYQHLYTDIDIFFRIYSFFRYWWDTATWWRY